MSNTYTRKNPSLTVNTHHAFLNTEIIIKSSIPDIDIVDISTGDKWHISDEIKIHLKAGEHTLFCEATNESISVYIEDAIKLGGGEIKNARAFVFDNNSWVFVILKDRMYAQNTTNNDTKCEHRISPKEIIKLGDNGDDAEDYFMLRTENDYSIYHVSTAEQIIHFNTYLYVNNKIVIYQDKDSECYSIYDYISRKSLHTFKGECTIGTNFYFVDDNRQLFSFNYNTLEFKPINLSIPSENFTLIKDYLLYLIQDDINNKQYELSYLSEGAYEKYLIRNPYYISSFLGKCLKENTPIRIDIFDANYIHNQCKVNLFGKLEIERMPKFTENQFVLECKLGYSYYNSLTNISRYEEQETLDSAIDTDTKDTNLVSLRVGENQLAESKSGDKFVTLYESKFYLYEYNTHKPLLLFDNILDTSFYKDAAFTRDGKNIIVKLNNEDRYQSFDIEKMISQPFYSEGFTMGNNDIGSNGYDPIIDFDDNDSRIPIWKDPVSLQSITPKQAKRHGLLFESLDGKYIANVKPVKKFYNILSNNYITGNEYLNLKIIYDWTELSKDEEKNKRQVEEHKKEINSKIEKRLTLLKQYDIFDLLKHCKYKIDNATINNNREKIENKLYTVVRERGDFSKCLVEERYFVNIKNRHDDSSKEFFIGQNIRYLNYVTFSYDSKFVGICAKCKPNPQLEWVDSNFSRFNNKFNSYFRRCNNENNKAEPGIFKIYNIEENTLRYEGSKSLWAVWLSLFNQQGDVAYYDTHPNTYIVHNDSTIPTIQEIEGRNLLCFSHSGNLLALSNQGYIPYNCGENKNWGHQPSTNVHVYKKNAHEFVQNVTYNDLGCNISGTFRPKSVASAAFSIDEKRLLMVGVDGVIVVRNLHL